MASAAMILHWLLSTYSSQVATPSRACAVLKMTVWFQFREESKPLRFIDIAPRPGVYRVSAPQLPRFSTIFKANVL